MSERLVYFRHCWAGIIRAPHAEMLMWSPSPKGRFIVLGGSFDQDSPLARDPAGNGVSRGTYPSRVRGWRLAFSQQVLRGIRGTVTVMGGSVIDYGDWMPIFKDLPPLLSSRCRCEDNRLFIGDIAEVSGVRPEDLLLYVGLKTKTRFYDMALKGTLLKHYRARGRGKP